MSCAQEWAYSEPSTVSIRSQKSVSRTAAVCPMDDNHAVTLVLGALARDWFTTAFPAPTPAQEGAWESIARGDDTLVVAPTGSGKTLAAFLHAIDRVASEPPPEDPLRRCRVLYISPLKALAVDVERNLRSPLTGIRHEAARRGASLPDITMGMRTGDTPASERARMARRPPDILITTPESLFLLLTSRARETLRGVETVIIDEVHAVAGTKRGAHLALSLERLDQLLDQPAQRIGLSATVRPIETVASWLRPTTPATIVAPPSTKAWDLQVRVPVENMADLGAETEVRGSAAGSVGRTSIWPHLDEELVDLIEQQRSTLVFVNSRRLAERVTSRINEIARERAEDDDLVIARAHHGSVSREQRAVIEEDLKAGRLPAVVATSSLELGIDMGAIDLVVQIETPPSVASGLQRVGRAGHQVGAVSRGVILPKYRGDLLTAAVVSSRMQAGAIEEIHTPRHPLDVLAQQIVAALAMDDWTVSDLLAAVRRSAPFTELPESVFASVLDMLSGRYPSDEFAELRPRLVWDRETDRLSARPGAQRLAVTSGGTIPDRGLFAVFLIGTDDGRGGRRVGELDEEMVYESRVGDVIALGASSWRIEEITHDRVLVSPAPGEPGRLPFWHGDALGRPAALGRAVGEFIRAVGGSTDPEAVLAPAGLDERARANLLAYLADQRDATGRLPSDTDIVVERFRDELGDWRIVVHSPFGAQVHAPWALLLGARLRAETGLDAQVMHADDGIVLRLPDTDDEDAARRVTDLIAIDPEEVEPGVTRELGGAALFASRFRECAARALLLPKRRPDRRAPLWQQRQRSAHLLEVAAQHADFPIILETVRECLQDVYDVPALTALLGDIQAGRVQVHEVMTERPSPFAQSLLLGYVASFLYEGDAPLAERRAQALTLDPVLLAELLGTSELRDLLDAEAIGEVEAELQHLSPSRHARDAEDAADLLRILGPLTAEQAEAHGIDPEWLLALIADRRAVAVRIAGADATAAIEDAGRLRDALGVAMPPGIPDAHLDAGADPLGFLLARYARTHGPFTADELAAALGLPRAVAESGLSALVTSGRLARGEFRPVEAGGSPTHREFCDPQVLRRIRRRSIARLRHEVEPVPPEQYADFLSTWQHITPVGERAALRGPDACFEVVDQLAGAALPASTWTTSVLPSRVDGVQDTELDTLLASGEVVWWGVSPLPGGDGVVAMAPADRAAALLPAAGDELSEGAALVVAALQEGGAQFFRDLADRCTVAASHSPLPDDAALVDALWEAVWAGLVTNDSWVALRARLAGTTGSASSGRRGGARSRRRALPTRTGPAAGAGRWSLLAPLRDSIDLTTASTVRAEVLLERYGIVTRGAVSSERIEGGFARMYRVFQAFEDAGRCQRVYAVDGLGAAQFGSTTAIDRLRATRTDRSARVVVLAATDPAQPYGATLGWPAHPKDGLGQRPGRKAGALTVSVDGVLILFCEKGGRTLLSWSDDDSVLASALAGLATTAPRYGLARFIVTRIDGEPIDQTWGDRFRAAGFLPTPRGWRSPVTGP